MAYLRMLMLKIFYNLMLFAFLFFLGCSKEERREGEKRYFFQSQNKMYYEIKSNFDYLKLLENKQLVKKNILLFFLDIYSVDCLEYMQVLKNLQRDYKDLEVVAISIKKLSLEQMQDFITQHAMNFVLLNPSDSKKLLEDFGSKLHESIQAPFLVLYDKREKRYQDYRGAVPQEMLMFDLSNI